jgi:surfeit locus 1 family protein
MKLAGREFRPAAWSVLLTCAGVALFCALGLWQLERAAYKQAIEDKYAARLGADYRRYRPGDETGDIAYRKLRFDGRFDPEHHFLLDNQTHQGRAGYHVLTPFRLRDSDAILLVDRGWAPWGASRDPLPAIEPAPASSAVSGIAHLPEKSKFQIGEVELNSEWPQLIPYLDLEMLREQYSPRLLPMVLWMAPETADPYLREWRPVWLPPQKSRAYAVQWFSFAVVALLLFFILNLRKTE